MKADWMLTDLRMIHTLQAVLHKQTQLLKNSCIMFPFIRSLFAFILSFEGQNVSVKIYSLMCNTATRISILDPQYGV